VLVDGLQPLRADPQSNPAFFTGQPEAVLVDVGVPTPPGFAVGVGDIVAERWLASCYIAFI